MAPLDNPGTGNGRKSSEPTLEDRVEALEHVVFTMMALAARKEPELRPVMFKELMTLVRDADSNPKDDNTPDRKYRATTDIGQAIEFIKDAFMDKS